jgi:hypothetical protein
MNEKHEKQDRLSAALAALTPQQVARATWRAWRVVQLDRAIREGRVDERAIVRAGHDEQG